MTSTPWGPSQSARQLAPGIMLYSTAGHGGIHLSAARLAELPARLHKRHSGYAPLDWFEEDCEAALVMVGFPQYFTADQVETAQRTIAVYYPEQAAPGLCPVCGGRITLRHPGAKDGRLIGSCGDAFTVDRWLAPDDGEAGS